MFDTSRDILNITLSASVGILTILLGWLLVYCIRITRTLSDLSRRIDETIRLAEETLSTLRDRARDLKSVLPLLVKMTEKLITYLGERKRQKKSSIDS